MRNQPVAGQGANDITTDMVASSQWRTGTKFLGGSTVAESAHSAGIANGTFGVGPTLSESFISPGTPSVSGGAASKNRIPEGQGGRTSGTQVDAGPFGTDTSKGV